MTPPPPPDHPETFGPAYAAFPVRGPGGELADVRVEVGGKSWTLAGRGGPEAEARLAANVPVDGSVLPVLVGSGLGAALAELLDRLPPPGSGPDGTPLPLVAVVDREAPILGVTGLDATLLADPRVLWCRQDTGREVLGALTRWQAARGGARFAPVVLPLYPRLDPGHYRAVADALKASAKADFWEAARYPRFSSTLPRVLLLTSQYFLMGELVAACERLGAPYRLIDIGDKVTLRADFVKSLLAAVVEFRPDFVLTVNHLGVDREGVLADLLERMGLPLASWFVDNPHLILYLYPRLASPLTAIFTWDSDNVESLRARGFANVRYLPLATDVTRFTPGAPAPRPLPSADVAFVGNSNVYKVGRRLKASRPPRPLLLAYRELSRAFGASEERSAAAFLADCRPDLAPYFDALPTLERKLAFETLINWEATRQYRLDCVRRLAPFAPLIVGDTGWKQSLGPELPRFTLHPELAYYDELPAFYPRVAVNFNCTSKQMKGAVNQRVFDVPACGAFLVTDHRAQMEELFDLGSEVVCYREPGEIPELVGRYLKDRPARERIAAAARRRILAEHTYDKRLTQLFAMMRETFA